MVNLDHSGPEWRPSEITSEAKNLIPAALRALEFSLIPAKPNDIAIALHRLAAHFWSERGKSEWKIVVEDYTRLLGDIPADILAAAVDRYLCSKVYWPKVAELRELAAPAWSKRLLARARLEQLGRVPVAAPRPPPTPEQVARVETAIRKAGLGLRMG